MGVVRQPNINYDGRPLVDQHGFHRPKVITIHDTESFDHLGVHDLQGIAAFWNRQGKGFGAHAGVDKVGLSARYVNDDQIAWHTGGHNTNNLGIELIGFARFSKAIWLTRPKQLEKTARWIAYYSKTYGIPIQKSLTHGVATHRQWSAAFPQDTQHSDPGAFFPFWAVLARARYLKQHGWT